MSTVENSLGTQSEHSQRCEKCGAFLETGGTSNPNGISGTAVCEACGAVLSPSAADRGTAGDFRAPIEASPAPGKRNPFALIVVGLVLAAMLYFGPRLARRSAPTPPVTKSSVAPDFTLNSLDGKSLRLSDLRGKAVLLNFWATWCGPCKIETPWLVELQNQYKSQGLQIVGVEMGGDSKEDIESFVKEMGMNYPVLLGKEAVGEAYGGVPAMPESFFIGRDGKIVDRILGLRGRADIEDSIKKALDTQAATMQTALQPQK